MVSRAIGLVVCCLFALSASGQDEEKPRPMIPAQAGLKLVLPECGGLTAHVCHNLCPEAIDPQVDQSARTAWSEAFRAEAGEHWGLAWDDSTDFIMATRFFQFANAVHGRFLDQSIESSASSKNSRSRCKSTLEERYKIYREHIDLNPVMAVVHPLMTAVVDGAFKRTGLYRKVERGYHQMLLDRLKLWYSEDMVRRIRDGIDSECPFIFWHGPSEDPCTSSPPSESDLQVVLEAA